MGGLGEQGQQKVERPAGRDQEGLKFSGSNGALSKSIVVFETKYMVAE